MADLDAIATAQMEVVEAVRAQAILSYQRAQVREGHLGKLIYVTPAGASPELIGHCSALQGVLHTLGVIEGNVRTRNELRRQETEQADA